MELSRRSSRPGESSAAWSSPEKANWTLKQKLQFHQRDNDDANNNVTDDDTSIDGDDNKDASSSNKATPTMTTTITTMTITTMTTTITTMIATKHRRQ